MTRQCMDCRTNMGEKCPRCGKENLRSRFEPRDPENPSGDLVKLYTCQNELCPHLTETGIRLEFERGDGPKGAKNVITTGLCRWCLNSRMGKLDGKDDRGSMPVR